MKIVKYVVLLLLLASIAITVFIATQDGSYTVKKEKVINVPRAVLYNYINEYKNWENLGLLNSADSTATYSYSNATAGTGAYMNWQKNSTTGRITTVAAADNDSISQKADINDLESLISWRFKDTLNSTKVSVKLSGKLTFTEKAYAIMQGGIDNGFEKTLTKGLENLDAFLVTELRKYNVDVEGLVTKNGAFYIGQTATGSVADVSAKAQAHFAVLQVFVKQNKIVTTGQPFILYKNLDKAAQTATYTFAIPIKDEIFTTPGSEYEGGKINRYTALKTTLKGDYTHVSKAWKAAGSYINEKSLQENTTGTYIEVFAKGSAQTRRPSQWETDIYIPIGAPAPVDVMDMDIPLPPINNTTAKPAGGTAPVRAVNTAAKPATTGTTQKPATATPKPSAQKPATGNGSTTAKPATTTSAKPAGTATGNTAKPATTSTAKPATGTANKPATTTAKPASATATKKPATTTTATPKPKPAAEKPANGRLDDMNPPRAED